jgi:hypothetical protein
MYFGSLDQHHWSFFSERVADKTANSIFSTILAAMVARATGRKVIHG